MSAAGPELASEGRRLNWGLNRFRGITAEDSTLVISEHSALGGVFREPGEE